MLPLKRVPVVNEYAIVVIVGIFVEKERLHHVICSFLALLGQRFGVKDLSNNQTLWASPLSIINFAYFHKMS